MVNLQAVLTLSYFSSTNVDHRLSPKRNPVTGLPRLPHEGTRDPCPTGSQPTPVDFITRLLKVEQSCPFQSGALEQCSNPAGTQEFVDLSKA